MSMLNGSPDPEESLPRDCRTMVRLAELAFALWIVLVYGFFIAPFVADARLMERFGRLLRLVR